MIRLARVLRLARLGRLVASGALALTLTAANPREAEATPGRKVFALIVTNNRSAELNRPELRYADDDGVKYLEVFRMIADDDRVHLLTELDADSARLFPDASALARAPTKAMVKSVTAQIARAVGEARRAGEQVDFYFVFAGHGDVDRGKGFLELKDGRLTSDDIESLIKSVPSTRSHVILDSCNSFFVLNARKPGGHRVAVTADAARSLSDRLPNVGVFLSTSAEAEVFEWSELQSGIFSHAVRSGILGGADVNGDGDVSYDELRAFVDIASGSVKNPLYRPQVFARGPGGSGSATLFPLGRAKGVRIELDAAPRSRLTVRDGDALPWIDVHKEAGTPATLKIPAQWAARASVEEREPSEAASRVLRRYALDAVPPDEPIRLAALTPAPPSGETRGVNDVLRLLFAAPFGARAMAAYQAKTPKASETVYGVSQDDAERMRQLLSHAADVDRSDRTMTNSIRLVGGSLELAASLIALGRGTADEGGPGGMPSLYKGLTYGMVGAGVVTVGLGAYGMLIHRSPGEKLHDEFVSGLAGSSADLPGLVARTEERLYQLADEYRLDRKLSAGFGIGLTAICAAGVVANEFLPWRGQERYFVRVGFTTFTVLTAAFSTYLLFPSPMERIADLWANDPGLTRLPRLSIAPIQTGWNVDGVMLSAGGVF